MDESQSPKTVAHEASHVPGDDVGHPEQASNAISAENGNGDSAMSVSGGGGNSGSSRAPVTKDKQCLYCHLAFTSSALGRHYDQFLFKKKPDGIHDVEQIRQMRSNITRRTARTSSAAAELAKQEALQTAGLPDANSVRPVRQGPGMYAGAEALPVDHRQSVARAGPQPYQSYYNQSSYPSSGILHIGPPPARPPQTETKTYAPQTVRAMELALREVLDNIQTATYKVQARVLPFDFELQSQTFPSLCLQSLPPPPTLSSPAPFPSDTSYTIQPPTAELKEPVQQALREKIAQWKEEQLASLASQKRKNQSPVTSHKMEADLIERAAKQHEEMILKHLDLSLKHWESLSEDVQREHWHLELMRALARESQKRRNLEEKLSRSHQESAQLRGQLEKLSSLQFPREFALFPPDMLPIHTAVIRELEGTGGSLDNFDPSRWDFDTILNKWKRVVMHDTSHGVPNAHLMPSAPGPLTVPVPASALASPTSAAVPGQIGAQVTVPDNGNPYSDTGFAFPSNNGYGNPTQQPQNTNQDPFMQYPTPTANASSEQGPVTKRRRVSNPNSPSTSTGESQQQQQQSSSQASMHTFQPPVGPSSVEDPNRSASRNKKVPLSQQYRFKYASGPNTPKASSLHSPPAQNSNFPGSTPPNGMYPQSGQLNNSMSGSNTQGQQNMPAPNQHMQANPGLYQTNNPASRQYGNYTGMQQHQQVSGNAFPDMNFDNTPVNTPGHGTSDADATTSPRLSQNANLSLQQKSNSTS